MTEKKFLAALGSKIRKLRTKNGLSLSELADLCEVEKANLSRLELGRTNATILTLCKISKALNVHITELFADI